MIAFIGAGNMGSAIIGGIVKKAFAKPSEIIAIDKNEATLLKIKTEHNIMTSTDNSSISDADIVFLSVKPQVLYDVIADIKDKVNSDAVIVSIAAGQSIEKIEKAFGREIKLVRVMPNTPALVGEGMSALSPNESVSDAEVKKIQSLFSCLGKASVVSESLMDTVTAVSGSGPAYIFMMIDAMAKSGESFGMSKDDAITFAAQTTLGAAKMVLETNISPETLKQNVCSPGGTTIEAVKVFEENNFEKLVYDAMEACKKKSESM